MAMTRKQYLDLGGHEAHRAYYAQFVSDRTKDAVRDLFGLASLMASTDRHFNDIPLAKWDALAPVVSGGVDRAMRKLGDYLTPGGQVCILKEAARQVVEAEAARLGLVRDAAEASEMLGEDELEAYAWSRR